MHERGPGKTWPGQPRADPGVLSRFECELPQLTDNTCVTEQPTRESTRLEELTA